MNKQRNPTEKEDPAYSIVCELTDREKKALRAIKNDVEAKRDFDFLRRKIGCSDEFLIIHFVIDAWLPKYDDDLPTGVQRRKLKALASRIEELAERIQEANDLSYWRFTSVRVDLRENGGLASEADLKRLPELLSLYARNVRKKLRQTKLSQTSTMCTT